MTHPRTALVAGATGAVAKRLVERLAGTGWQVVGLSRNPPPAFAGVRYLGVDLTDPSAVHAALRNETAVTHVFYTARAKHGEGGVESVEDNVALLRHVLDAVEAAAPRLEHVHLVEGGKWYGQHLGAYLSPAREDDPRHMPPNFYYDQQDLLSARQQGKPWTWSASRPNVICDFAPERARNLVSILGALAAITRELNVPFDFPGRPGNYHALTEVTDATHLANALIFIATTPACRNEAFNVTNGDVFRWERLWPCMAEFYELRVGRIRPLSLAEWMRDKDPVWQRIVRKHDLAHRRLDEVALWSFADFVFRQDYDVVSSTTKLRRAGFHDVVDTQEMFFGQLRQYRDARIIP